ncbi:Heat shock protein 26 [Holothuria leucospilota]|uniref:Heat shock protein 26 n=1 Tax=Holothuria leucospilota TaxID=206669 RepID=A0A9Q1BGL7_HOLLE|nr:Heat shock protein 26 [Holothuria leucospilota]
MASLVIVPANEALFPRATRCCSCPGGFRYSPIRRRNQFPCRWSPAAHSLSRLFDRVDERDCENLWGPTLLLHLRERRSGEKESNGSNADTDKQQSEKTEENVPPTENKTPDKFSVSVELGDAFEPSEVSVKLVGRCLNIEGKHEETGDDGHFSCRQFTRSFYLPDDVDIENLTSALSKEGVLSVEAPRLKLKEKESEERNIAIQQTSPETVEEKKSDEAKDSNEEQNENVEAGKSEQVERKERTSSQPEPQTAEASRENSE